MERNLFLTRGQNEGKNQVRPKKKRVKSQQKKERRKTKEARRRGWRATGRWLRLATAEEELFGEIYKFIYFFTFIYLIYIIYKYNFIIKF